MKKTIGKVLAAVMLAAVMLCSGAAGVSASDPSTTTKTTTPAAEVKVPYLGSGAVVSGYTINTGSLYQNGMTTVTANCYIPIENYDGTSLSGLFKSINFATFDNNASFFSPSPITASPTGIVQDGPFVRFSLVFSGITYLGEGNTFAFRLNYLSDNSGLSVPLSMPIVEAVPAKEPEKQEEITVTPVFTLDANQSFFMSAGEEKSFSVGLSNLTSFYPALVTVEASSSASGITVMNTAIQRFGGYIDNYYGYGYASYTFDVTPKINVYADTTVPTGRYPVTLTINSFDQYGNSKKTDTVTIYVQVESNVRRDNIYISNFSVSSTQVKTGDVFNVAVNVTNNSGMDIKSARITLEGLDGSRFAMNSGLPSVPFTLKNNKTGQLTFTLVGCDGISSIREVIPVKLEYYVDPDKTDSLVSVSQNITIPCKPDENKKEDEKDEPEVFAPNIIIEKYDFGGEYATGGKTFTLNISPKNASSTGTIKNLKITIQGAAGTGENGLAYSPANSSNSFFFEVLAPKQTVDISLDMLARADAKPDSYPIQVNYEYEYAQGKKTGKVTSVSETITVPLRQEDRFVISSSSVQSECYVNEPCGVYLTMINKGKSSVYNVSVKVEGDGFTVDSEEFYIGNVDSGTEEYFDTQIIPTTDGELSGKIVVTYEDGNGSGKELVQEFTSTTIDFSKQYEDMPMEDMPVYDEEPTGMKLSTKLIIAGIALTVIVIIIIVIVRTKRKKRKMMEDDDEDN